MFKEKWEYEEREIEKGRRRKLGRGRMWRYGESKVRRERGG